MSQYVVFANSTPFALVDGEVSLKKIRHEELISEYMDDYDVRIEEEDDGRYTLAFDGNDVGDSFQERIGRLVKALTPYVAEPFMVRVRENSMSDDRDEDIFGGPNEDAIDRFRGEYYLKEAMDLLKTHRKDVYEKVQAAMAGKLVSVDDVKVIVSIEDGVLSTATATHGVSLYQVNRDKDHASKETVIVSLRDCEAAISGIADVPPAPERHRMA